MSIDWDSVKAELSYIAHGDHMGDVNNALPELCEALGLPKPEWNDDWNSYQMAWDENDG